MNPDDLPDEIAQPLRQLGRALVAHARAHRDTSLAEHEDGVLTAWRVVAPTLLESVLRLATTGLEKSARPRASRCPRCEQRRGVQSQRKRQMQKRLEEPSHREQAEHIHGKLAEQLQTLRFLEYEPRHRSAQDVDERTRARAVVTPLDHLQQAMDALEMVGRE